VTEEEYDGATLKNALSQTERLTDTKPKQAIVDKGFWGATYHPADVEVSNGTVSASSNEDMVTSVWNSPPLLVNVCFSLTEMGHLAGASRIQTTTALYC
jgi:hypothetical protein